MDEEQQSKVIICPKCMMDSDELALMVRTIARPVVMEAVQVAKDELWDNFLIQVGKSVLKKAFWVIGFLVLLTLSPQDIKQALKSIL